MFSEEFLRVWAKIVELQPKWVPNSILKSRIGQSGIGGAEGVEFSEKIETMDIRGHIIMTCPSIDTGNGSYTDYEEPIHLWFYVDVTIDGASKAIINRSYHATDDSDEFKFLFDYFKQLKKYFLKEHENRMKIFFDSKLRRSS